MTNLPHVFRSSLLVGFFFALDKAVALARQVIVGQYYGVGAALDAYNAANNLPDLLFALISGGASAFFNTMATRISSSGGSIATVSPQPNREIRRSSIPVISLG